MSLRRTQGTGRERAVLAGGALAAAALLGAAFLTRTDPGVLGQASVARAAAAVADGVAREWERLARGESLLEGPAAERFRWRAEELSAPAPEARDLRRERGGGCEAFDLFFAEAGRRAAAGEPEAARGLVADALERPRDAARTAEALVAAVRYAAAAGDAPGTLAAWRRADAELAGTDAQGDVAYVLLAALAALPALEEGERAAVAGRAADLWARDELALPRDAARDAAALAAGPAPLRAALMAELLRGAGTLPDGVRAAEERGRARALLALLGGPPPPAQGPLGVLPLGDHLLLYRGEPDGWQRARLAPRADVEAALLAAAADLVPPGFRVDFGAEVRGVPVRAVTPLAGDALGFALRHDDPEALAAGDATRQAALRGGLVVMAVLVAAASAFAWRALGRERRLAALKSSFVAGVSHELRTPLASILLMAENLEQGRVAAEAAPRYHRLIRREAERLRRLVDDVLDFSRLERGEGPRLSPEELDAAPLLRHLEEDARERAEAGGGTLRFRSHGVPERLLADGEALRRAIQNLVDNALKHSGSRAVELSAEADNGELVLAVHDQGRGVPPERREEIFEPFARLADGPGAPPGAGLGLAIVRAIAAGHGGRAFARAPLTGPGAVFELRIPLAPLPGAEA